MIYHEHNAISGGEIEALMAVKWQWPDGGAKESVCERRE